jgi:hypothetical protein
MKQGGTMWLRGAAVLAAAFAPWFDFLAGFAYVASGVGLWLAGAIAVATLAVFAAFAWHVSAGSACKKIAPRGVSLSAIRPAG